MQAGYLPQVLALTRSSLVALVRAPSEPERRRALARSARQAGWLLAIGAIAIVVLIFAFDATEIGWMPPRGAPSLWLFRILTDFGKDDYVLWLLFGVMVVVTLAAPRAEASLRPRLLGFDARVGYLFLAVLLPVLIGQVLKWAVGRGRPFVGGKADPFNFAPFTGHEPYFSLPSSHAITAFALAFAVGAIWPRARVAMAIYALAIAFTRLVLLAHHPSDIVAGGVVGVIGALWVRYWFASRSLVFVIGEAGRIAPPAEPIPA
jgi:membrane-associated phospholipid phosphatase